MSRIRRNMEDSGKHRFCSLEHDSKMRLSKTHSHTSTLRGYESSRKMLKEKITKEERKTGKGVQNTPANGRIDRRESYLFPQIGGGDGARKKGKRELCRKIKTKQVRKRWGRKRKSQRPREQKPQAVAKAYQDALRTKLNSRVRNGYRASPCGGTVETGRRITRKIPPGNLNQKPGTKTNIPRRNKIQNWENRIKHSRAAVA